MHDLIRLLVVIAGLGAAAWSAVSAFRLQHRAVAVDGVVDRARRNLTGWITEFHYTDATGRQCTGRLTGREQPGDTVRLRYADLWSRRSLAPAGAAWPYAQPVCLALAAALAVGLTYLL